MAGNHDAGAECPQVERFEIDEVVQRRVGGVEQLKAMVEQKSVDVVGPDSSSDGVVCLKHDNVESGRGRRRSRS